MLNSSVGALNPNSTLPQCFEAEIPVQDIQYADSNTSSSLKICLMLLNDSAKCVHISEPCIGIKFGSISNDTDSKLKCINCILYISFIIRHNSYIL